MVAVADECLHVWLGGRMSVHVEIHGWSDEDGSLHGEIGGDEHIVGNAVCHLAHGRGGAGRDEHGVRPETEVNVRIPGAVALREELAHHGLVGECREGDRGDELLARRGDDHLHLGTSLNQSAYDEALLVNSLPRIQVK